MRLDTVPYTTMKEFVEECARHRLKGSCNKACGSCPSNIHLYGVPKQKTVMMLHEATLKLKRERAEAAYVKREERVQAIVQLIIWAVIAGAILWACNSCVSYEPPLTTGYVNVVPILYPHDPPVWQVDCKDKVLAYYLIDPTVRIIYGIFHGDDGSRWIHVWIRKNGYDIEPFAPLNWNGLFQHGYWTNIKDVTEIMIRSYNEQRPVDWLAGGGNRLIGDL